MIRPEDITIIIPHLGATKEQEYALDECLFSLQKTAPEMKKIVSINGEMQCDGHKPFAAQENDPSIKIIGIQEQGQCRAVNAAAATVNTPFLLISNDDMIYPEGWFEQITKGASQTIFPICLSPQLVEPRPGAPTFEVFFAGGAGGDFDAEAFARFAARRETEPVKPLRTGFNFPLLIYKRLWDAIGGYDINYDPWGSNSDSDLEYKIKLAGIQPMQNPNWFVYHFSQTSGTFEPKNDAYRHKNYGYFKEKWGFDRTDDGIWEASFQIPGKDGGRIYWPEFEGKFGGGKL